MISLLNDDEKKSLAVIGSTYDKDKLEDVHKYFTGKPHPMKKKTEVIYLLLDHGSINAYLKTFDLSKIVVYKVGLVGEGLRPFGKRFSDYRTDSEPATLYMNDKTKRNVIMIAFETNRASSLEQELISCFKEHMNDVAPPFCIKEGGTGRVTV